MTDPFTEAPLETRKFVQAKEVSVPAARSDNRIKKYFFIVY
jgi:hypothetical protein